MKKLFKKLFRKQTQDIEAANKLEEGQRKQEEKNARVAKANKVFDNQIEQLRKEFLNASVDEQMKIAEIEERLYKLKYLVYSNEMHISY